MKWSFICFAARAILIVILTITYHTNISILFFGGIVSLITLELLQLRRLQKDKIRSDKRKQNFICTIDELEHELEENSSQLEEYILQFTEIQAEFDAYKADKRQEIARLMEHKAFLEEEINREILTINRLNQSILELRENCDRDERDKNEITRLQQQLAEANNKQKYLQREKVNSEDSIANLETQIAFHKKIAKEIISSKEQQIEKAENKNKNLKRENEQLIDYTDLGIQELKEKNRSLKKELEDYESLKKEFDKILLENANLKDLIEKLKASKFGKSKKIVLIGGHCNTRSKVIEILRDKNNLYSYGEIPPSNENRICKRSVRAKIENADLVVVITGYIGHDLSEIVKDLEHVLRGEVIWINKRGSTGIIREIEKHLIEKAS